MKLILFFVASVAIAEPIAIDYGLDFAAYYGGTVGRVMVEDNRERIRERTSAAEIAFTARVGYSMFFAGGTTSTVVHMESAAVYAPIFSWYLLEAGIKFRGGEIYYEHLCAHTSTTFGYQYHLMTGVDKSYDKIGIRFGRRAVR